MTEPTKNVDTKAAKPITSSGITYAITGICAAWVVVAVCIQYAAGRTFIGQFVSYKIDRAGLDDNERLALSFLSICALIGLTVVCYATVMAIITMVSKTAKENVGK